MSMVEAFRYLTQGIFLLVAVYVVFYTIKRPTRSNLHILLFFSLLTVIIAYTWAQRLLEVIPVPASDLAAPILVMALPYVLLRLAHQFSSVERHFMRVAEAGLGIAVLLILYPGVENPLILVAVLAYFVGVAGYAAWRFKEGAESANGITRKRLAAIALATVSLSAALATTAITTVVGGLVDVVTELSRQVLLMLSALLYLVGFATPAVFRQAWQEPVLRGFLHQTLELPRWSRENDVIRRIEELSAEATGAPNAVVGIWNPETELIEFPRNHFRPGETIGGRAFLERQPILSLDTIADDPDSREIYERGQAFAVMAAPIDTEDGPIGVVALHSPNPPIFAEDDLSLLKLISDQVAILLQNRRHVEAQAELAAREETTRLKDEFLSVAAHDLKTPLTTIVATGQYLERRLASTGEDSPEVRSITRLNREAKRLQHLVQSLLDTSRVEQGQLTTELIPTKLNGLISDTLDRSEAYATHNVDAEIEEDLVGEVDSARIQQVLENLLENARKYSPRGSTIRIRAWSEGDEIRFSVSDEGIGIHQEDVPKVFERYYRTSATENGSAPGIGLGLYICKQIVDLHDGRIWVESTPGIRTTFNVALPRAAVDQATHGTVNTGR